MVDKSVIKVDAPSAPVGPDGQRYLAAGRALSMRLWAHQPAGVARPEASRDYETVGFALTGRAELSIEGQTVLLEPGSSWVIPRGARHSYHILEDFSAVEATTPPAEFHDRDRATGEKA